MFLTPPRPPLPLPPSRPAPDGKCSCIFLKPARRVAGCCAGTGAKGMKYSCSPPPQPSLNRRKKKRMDIPGRRTCRFIQVRPGLIKLLAAGQVTVIFFTTTRPRKRERERERSLNAKFVPVTPHYNISDLSADRSVTGAEVVSPP